MKTETLLYSTSPSSHPTQKLRRFSNINIKYRNKCRKQKRLQTTTPRSLRTLLIELAAKAACERYSTRMWIDWKSSSSGDTTPFRFTAQEFDPETGLYYYGARYLDPRISRWLSVDPAMYQGDYLPSAPINDEARKRNQNLPGMGGIYNYVNFHVYHYAANNPVKYIDPDGRTTLRTEQIRQVQNTVMNARIYLRGGGGAFPRSGSFGPDFTYCNLATYDLAIATGFNTTVLFGNNRYETTANQAGINLRNAAATKGTGIVAVTPQTAQILANEGYLVIASWVNDRGIGHIATVRPSTTPYDSDSGPLIANVGLANGVLSERIAFDGNTPVYFIDTNQNINNNVNPLNIAKTRE